MECPVCYSDNVNSKDMVKCTICNFGCCKNCIKRYILEGIGKGSCMNCNKIYTTSFLVEVGGKTWVSRDTSKSYKSHLKKMYMEKEKSKIPDSITKMKEEAIKLKLSKSIVETQKKLTKLEIYDEFIVKYNSVIAKYINLMKKYNPSHTGRYFWRTFEKVAINKLYWGDYDDLLIEQVEELYNSKQKTVKLEEYKTQIEKMKKDESYINYYNLSIKYLDLLLGDPDNTKKKEVKTVTYIQGCPFENCRGLIVSGKYKCSVCSGKICKNCRIGFSDKQDKEHKCKKEDLETVRLLKSDSKPCPKCATIIYKISGCFQIFCTSCHVAFDWNTGKIDNGVIHNPHYFEFIRNRGMTIHDNIECGEIPNDNLLLYRMVTPKLKDKNIKNPQLYAFATHVIIDYHTIHMVYNLIYREFDRHINIFNDYIGENGDGEKRLYNTRVEYITNKITEKIWQKKIYEVYNKIEKNTFYVEIFNSFKMILIECFKKLYEDLGEPITEFYNETLYDDYVNEKNKIISIFMNYIEDARNYFNESIINEHHINSSTNKFLIFGPKWDIMLYSDLKKGYTRPSRYGSGDIDEPSFKVYSPRITLPRRLPPRRRFFQEEEVITDNEIGNITPIRSPLIPIIDRVGDYNFSDDYSIDSSGDDDIIIIEE